ncbi:unnamed protein product [Peronospora destructor]|uniref:Uncharacterized protein n=1 Tax=Peronospora destructor TaxID=86335 RepID=A0AAV0U7A4_9STRA|nr:unnamed protein product [Peronospora destructor]
MQLKKWQADKKSPEDVLKLLDLTVDTRLFESPLGNIWLDYLYLLKEKNNAEVLRILQTKFGDALVAKMLYDSSSVHERAKKLQEAQYKSWHTHTAYIPLDMDSDLLLEITASYFNWIKAQMLKV